MPPEKEKQPDKQKVIAVVDWTSARLREAEQAARLAGGHVLLRRLNRTEYGNTIRDLLDLSPAFVEKLVKELPSDGMVDGFDNIGAGLMLDPSLLDRYLLSAQAIAEEAIVTGPQPARTTTHRFEFAKHGEERTGNYIPDGIPKAPPGVVIKRPDAKGLTILHGPGPEKFGKAEGDDASSCDFPRESVPIEGEYILRVRVGAFRGILNEPVRMRFKQGYDGSNKPATTVEVEGTEEEPKVMTFRLQLKPGEPTSFVFAWNGLSIVKDNPEFQTLAAKIWMSLDAVSKLAEKKAKPEEIEAAKAKAVAAQKEGKEYHGGAPHLYDPKLDLNQTPRLRLEWAELEGPIYDQWPPRSHRKLLFEGDGAKQDLAYARRIFARLLPRAYRRPVADAEIDHIVRLVEKSIQQGRSFEDGIRLGLQAVLCSPKFLFLVEPSGPQSDIGRKLNDFELASRLSYFLWSTMPDDELSAVAAKGTLHQPDVLDTQVTRMLRDPRAGQFVTNFAGQWLHVREFGTIQPAKDLYKQYDKELEDAMRQEPLSFFQTVLNEDLSILNFLDSNFVVVNERLARHYGIKGVQGMAFRKMQLPPDSHRGGVLTQAGLLTLLSDGTRTLPVRRGAWILTNILNDPPNPPPPNAGEIQPNTSGKNLTVRQRLELHKRDETCASCHIKIDAYGYALENYDAVGAWRTRQNGEKFTDPATAPKVDASGTLPGGRSFDGPEAFKKALLERKDKFCSAFTQKLLTYALGRPVQYADRQTVSEVLKALEGNDYRLSALIHALVKTNTFQTK